MSNTTDASDIIEALKEQAREILSSELGTTPLQAFAVTGKGNMPYYWQDPRNLEFNKNTYGWIRSALVADADPYQLGEPFINIYIDALSKVGYSLSTDDLAKLNKAKDDAVDQQAAVLTAWKEAYGSFPSGKGQPIDNIAQEIATTWADPPTTLQDIQDSINVNKLLNAVPASGKPIVKVFTAWLDAIGESLTLENAVTMNNAYLAAALDAAQSPTAANGGLQLDDGDNLVPSYGVATSLSDILNGLKDDSNVVDLSMTVARSTEQEFTVTMQAGASFTIPVLDFLGVNVGGRSSYFQSDIATTDNVTTVTMNFPGVTLVSFAPTEFTKAPMENWYWTKPIKDAIANGDRDVSGYKFSPRPQIDFGPTGPFGFLVGAAISNYPTIEITVTSSSYERIQKTFEQSASVGLTFLGIPLGIGGQESSYSNKVEVDASTQTIKIKLEPPKELVAGAAVDSVGWVLGVQPTHPAA